MAEPGIGIFLFCALGIGLSGFVRGFFGFGFGLVGVPSLALVLDPRVAIGLAMTLQLVSGAVTLAADWRHVDGRMVRAMSMGALAGVPAGVALIGLLSPDAIRIAIALTLVGAVAALASGYRYGRPLRRGEMLVLGGACGLLNGVTGMGGPPAIVALLGGRLEAAVVRATLVAFFGVLGALTVAGFWATGLVSLEITVLALGLFPTLVLGTWLGGRAFARAPSDRYRPVAFALLLLLAVTALVRAVV